MVAKNAPEHEAGETDYEQSPAHKYALEGGSENLQNASSFHLPLNNTQIFLEHQP
jgi:hypothetical protein